MFRNIAVTTDFSTGSRLGLRAAASLARSLQARLLVVHVAEMAPQPAEQPFLMPWQIVPEDGPAAHRPPAEVRRRLDRLVREEACLHDLEIDPRLVHGEICDAVTRLQTEDAVDLFVVARRGHGDVARLVADSFTSRLLRAGSCPVLVVRERPDVAATPSKPRILVPVDFSEPCEAAIDCAAHLARGLEGSVRLVFVAPKANSPFDRLAARRGARIGIGALSPEDILAELEGIARERLSGVSRSTVVREGRAPAQIVAEASQCEAHVIVLGSHCRPDGYGYSAESVAEDVLQGAPCSVLVC